MAEMSPAVTFTRLQVEQTGGSCGQLLPNTNMEVLDLVTEEEKGPGETGELCFQGPQVMPGYAAFFGANRSNLLLSVDVATFIGANTENMLFSFYKEYQVNYNTLVETVTGDME